MTNDPGPGMAGQGLGSRMALQDVQTTIEDERENLTLLEMSPVEPILTVVMPDQNMMSNMNIMNSDLMSNNDMIPDHGNVMRVEAVEQAPLQNAQIQERKPDAPPKKRPAARRPRAKKEPLSAPPPELSETVYGQGLLACTGCGKNFVSLSRLKSHEKTHSKARPFSCLECNKTFTVRYSLICHTRTHTRDRPYACSCGARFSQASSLKTHQIYKHTKDFPYLCRICNRGFISPGQRHEHVVRTHVKNGVKSSAPGKRKKKTNKKEAKREAEEPKEAIQAENVTFLVNGSNHQDVQANVSLSHVF